MGECASRDIDWILLFQLEQLEANHQGVLAAEWRRREEEREKATRDKLEEISELGEQLRKATAAVEAKEARLKMKAEMLQEKEARLRDKEEDIKTYKEVAAAQVRFE